LKSRKKWFTSKISCISLASDVGPMYLGTEEASGQASNDTPKRKFSNKAALCHYFEEHARCWECKILQSIIFVLTALVASVVVSCATHDKSWSHYPIEPWEGHSTSHLSIQYKHCADGCPFRMIVVSPLQFCTTNPLLFPLEWASNKSSGSTLPFL